MYVVSPLKGKAKDEWLSMAKGNAKTRPLLIKIEGSKPETVGMPWVVTATYWHNERAHRVSIEHDAPNGWDEKLADALEAHFQGVIAAQNGEPPF